MAGTSPAMTTEKLRREAPMAKQSFINRRTLIKSTAALVAMPALLNANSASAQAKVIKIGHVSPKTGPLAGFGEADPFILDQVKSILAKGLQSGGKTYKVDIVSKPKLLPILDQYSKAYSFAELVPLSAADGTNVDTLEGLFLRYLPEGEPLYPPEYFTDQTERFFASEIVREQVLQLTHDELPFSTAVVVDQFDESDPGLIKLYCTILVERESQKPIVVGKAGSMIKAIGTAARLGLEEHFQQKVFLDLHVKVKSEWRDDERLLDEMGLRS